MLRRCFGMFPLKYYASPPTVLYPTCQALANATPDEKLSWFPRHPADYPYLEALSFTSRSARVMRFCRNCISISEVEGRCDRVRSRWELAFAPSPTKVVWGASMERATWRAAHVAWKAIQAEDRYTGSVALPRAGGVVRIADLVRNDRLLRYPRTLRSYMSTAPPVEDVWVPRAIAR